MSNVVYYIGVKGENHVKIGTTKNLRSRLSALSTARADGNRLMVLATEPGSYELEQRRHEQFAGARLHGEWFTITPEIQRHIDRLVLQSDPTFALGYDEGYQTALSDREVIGLIQCRVCGAGQIPAWDDSEDDEPCDICGSCNSDLRADEAALGMIFEFMKHHGIEHTPDGYVQLPPYAQNHFEVMRRRYSNFQDIFTQTRMEVYA